MFLKSLLNGFRHYFTKRFRSDFALKTPLHQGYRSAALAKTGQCGLARVVIAHLPVRRSHSFGGNLYFQFFANRGMFD